MPGSFDGRAAGPLGHAEGGELGRARALLGEELGVERVGAGIAALDVVDAELVEQRRDGALVLEREVDAGRLRAVAQGGVEEIEAFAAGHRGSLPCADAEALLHGRVGEPFAADGHGVAALRREAARAEERLAPCR